MCSRPTDRRTRSGVIPASSCCSGKLPVGGGSRVDDQSLGVADIGQEGPELDIVDQALSCLQPPLDAKGKNGPMAVQVFLGKMVGGMFWQAGVADPVHLGVSLQIAGHRQPVFRVPFHAQGEGFQPLQEQEGG